MHRNRVGNFRILWLKELHLQFRILSHFCVADPKIREKATTSGLNTQRITPGIIFTMSIACMSGRKKFLAILFVEMALSKTEKNAIAGHRLVPVVILAKNHHQPNAQMVNAAIWKHVS